MGWFWADSPKPTISVAPHPVSNSAAKPPANCPAHKSDLTSIPFPPRTSAEASPSSCPVKAPNHPLRPASSSRLPTSAAEMPLPETSSSSSSSVLSKLNPLNYIPAGLSNTRPSDSPQTIALPLEREPSSIPRGDADANWEYPSPQQMYNAMLRKGYTDTPVDAVEPMVQIHNFLNEGAWQEIVEWENLFGKGLATGWEQCRRGEQGIAMERVKRDFQKARREALGLAEPISESGMVQPKLLRFMGRPTEPTPKARFLSLLGQAFPDTFNNDPPFDRHDWYVSRRKPDGSIKQVRYVIDYYAGGVQATGEPVFYLDIRPALDTPTAAAERLVRWGGDFWYRASGGIAREKEMAEKKK